MTKNLRYLGLDVHAETIAVALAEPGGEVRSLGTIPNESSAVAKLIRKLGGHEQLRACYEAGPCGYVLYWQLTKLGVACDVVAPTPKCGDALRTRQRGQPPGITDIAWKAQHRLHARDRRLLGRGKPVPHVITAVARELVGFTWAIGVAAERELAMAA